MVQIAAINLLTHDVVKAAAREIRTGEHIQLDWGLNVGVQFPGGGRKEFEQTIINGESYGVCAFDDVLHINTQSSSQWDSLKHVSLGTNTSAKTICQIVVAEVRRLTLILLVVGTPRKQDVL